MKVALVHEYLTNFAGSEQVLLALHEMFPDAPIYTAIYNEEKCPQFKNADIRTSFLQNFPQAKERYQVYIPLLPLAVEGYDLGEYDLVISDTHIATKGVITKPDTVHISYCHTPIRYAWSPEIDPRASSSIIRRVANHYLRLWDAQAAKRVDYWIANSAYIAKRIKKYYRADATVINPPVDLDNYQIAKDDKIEDYYVMFGRLISYKYPDIAVQAFNRLGKPLKIIGRGPMLEEIKAMAGPNIEIISDYLPYSEITEIFSHASAMVFPAEEDFGLNMVEMLAAGRPVIAYKAGGASEIVIPGKTGELFEEQTVESLIDAVAGFDPLRYDKNVIRAHAETFDKQLFKKKMQAFIDKVVKKGN
jgi:glycosyltransferase involved in cell wall biosynthesis